MSDFKIENKNDISSIHRKASFQIHVLIFQLYWELVLLLEHGLFSLGYGIACSGIGYLLFQGGLGGGYAAQGS